MEQLFSSSQPYSSVPPQLHQKRQNSMSIEFLNQGVNKRRLAEAGATAKGLKQAANSNGESIADQISIMSARVHLSDQLNIRSREVVLPPKCFLDIGEAVESSPVKNDSETISPENPLKLTPQPHSDFTPQSPYYLPTTLSSTMGTATKAIDNSSIKQVCGRTLPDSKTQVQAQTSQSSSLNAPGEHSTLGSYKIAPVGEGHNLFVDHCKDGTYMKQNPGEQQDGAEDITGESSIEKNDRQYASNTHNSVGNARSSESNQDSFSSANNNDQQDKKNNNNETNNNGVPQVAAKTRPSSQALIEKLQEIYRNIVRQETELQERCSHLTTSQTTDLKNLWVIYKLNAELIDNYFMFITTALLPTQPEADLLIGQEIIEVYRIERRLWVYGTITFLDVLKNFSDFMDPEVCCQFIIYVFISISNMIGDIPPKFRVIWLERLGDLSRMAIALYPTGFVDWKLSAEYWYHEALKFNFGHGKLYYHMSTVQQNTLAAFVNLGKSVFCHDTFIPSQQYMQLVIANIYQRAFAERKGGYYRNSQLVEYLKHTEVMLLPSFLGNTELQHVVLAFFEHKFGVNTGTNFFDPKLIFVQDGERLKHFFRYAPLYAESHILQLVGFGDPKNPFALLFGLPKFLKEKKGRKEKRKSKPTESNQSDVPIEDYVVTDVAQFFESIASTRVAYSFPEDVNIWRESLNYINLTSMQCSMFVLRKFLNGPFLTALPHLLPWIYFLVAVGLRLSEIENEEVQKFWVTFIRHIFPWDTIVTFLNVLLFYMNSHRQSNPMVDEYMSRFYDMPLLDILNHFCEDEELPEVWNCWGTLWFDTINKRHAIDPEELNSGEEKDYMFLDSPIDGIIFDHSDESGEKFWKRCTRLIILFRAFSNEFPFGCVEISRDSHWSSLSFKFEEPPKDWRDQYLGSFASNYPVFEEISPVNADPHALPPRGMIPGVDITSLPGYRILLLDYHCFNKNGDKITASVYTSGRLEGGGIQGADDFNGKRLLENGQLVTSECLDYDNLIDREEKPILEEFLCKAHYVDDSHWEQLLPRGDLQCYADTHVTYFVLDATTWLRHFGHIYKLATNNVLKFAICLTTFQELRFLRKSKDESVLEAATRAVITVRQLYYERKLLPLRFTGNVAGHLEEHLEIEEQMTWRTHVDEFVIEAIDRAQAKFNQANSESRATNHAAIVAAGGEKFNFISLITDDINMRNKAKAQNIRAFSTRFIFSVCNEIGAQKKVCTK
ncbi:HHR243Wp [Eremothecium sinecaudum]|uniref:HHR243Wp n=1 Tax=Eremothecium sinecaudum TaxID=45286 RepID=A0A109V0M3_9SACH|nr:HHR243Wp [Eremothecium sinecaudum]AMD23012.1 HHR243Wp [Eremothecium sinecaudum]